MKTDVTNYTREVPEALNNKIVKPSGTMKKGLVCLNLELQKTNLQMGLELNIT